METKAERVPSGKIWIELSRGGSDYYTPEEALKLANAIYAAAGVERWEPVEDGFKYLDGMRYGEGELCISDNEIAISAEGGYVWGATELPDNIRLCRKV